MRCVLLTSHVMKTTVLITKMNLYMLSKTLLIFLQILPYLFHQMNGSKKYFHIKRSGGSYMNPTSFFSKLLIDSKYDSNSFIDTAFITGTQTVLPSKSNASLSFIKSSR